MSEVRSSKKRGKSTGGSKKKTTRSGGFTNTAVFRVNDIVKVSVKAATVFAALAAVIILFAAGADISPSGILQGFRDKYIFITAMGSGYPVEVPGSRTIKAAHITRGTAVLTDTSFVIYDSKGRTVLSEVHQFSSPSMENSRKFSLLYSRGGKDFTMRTLSGTACSGKTENVIICADVCADGRFAFVTKSETTDAEIVVYSKDGTVLNKWKSVDQKVSDISISPSGKYIAWVGLSTDNGVLVSTVNMRKIGENKNMKEYVFQDTLIADIRFEGNSMVAAVGDNFASFMGVTGDNSFLYPYDGNNLNSYCFNDCGELALVFSANTDGRNAWVTVINSECLEKARIQTDITSPLVDLANDRISLLSGSSVCSYSYNGKLLRRSDVPVDANMILTSEGRLIAKGSITITAVD